MKRKRHAREQWSEWLVEQPSSGLSEKHFAAANKSQRIRFMFGVEN